MKTINQRFNNLSKTWPTFETDLKLDSARGFLKVLLIVIIEFAFLILIFPIVFETSDDSRMNALVSGAFTGESCEYLFFTNILLGKLLKVFYGIVPSLNWYTMYLLGSLFAGYLAIQYSFYRLKADFGIRIIRHIFILATLLFSLHNAGFTRVAIIASTGGYLLVLLNNNKRNTDLIAGTALIVLASLIRLPVFYMHLVISLPFLFILLLQLKYRKLAFVLIAFVLAFGASKYDKFVYRNNPEYADYRSNNSVRSSLLSIDNPFVDYEDYEERATAVGWTQEDFSLVSHSLYDVGHEKFDQSNLTQVAATKKPIQDKLYTTLIIKELKNTIRLIWQHLNGRYFYVVALFLIMLIFLARRPRTLLLIFSYSMYILLVAFALYYFKEGPLKPRVLIGMILPFILLILLLLDEHGDLPKKMLFFEGVDKNNVRMIILSITISTMILTGYHYKQESEYTCHARDRVHEYHNYVNAQNHMFCVQRMGSNPFYIYKNPPLQRNRYVLNSFIGSPSNRALIEKYAKQKDVGIFNIFDKDIIWYFGEQMVKKEAPIVESFYLSNYPNCQVTKDTILVAETYNLYRYTFFIPSTDSLSTEYPAMGDSVQAREEEEQTIKP
jgi:hypothetical protein